MPDKLRDYRAKRDFSATPEPGAGRGAKGTKAKKGTKARKGAKAPRFVIQEHHATRLHWDLRLEHEGALASWAVPNGIPADPKENRLAVRTEDHPLEYIDFHGEIPKGSYGAGTMTVWDRGTYETILWTDDKVEVVLDGERVSGRYGLFPIGRRADGGGSEKDWMIHRMDPPADAGREPMPDFFTPMLARAGKLPADESEWAFEVKWDGIRAVAFSKPGRLKLFSRNGNDVTSQYPELAGLNRALSHHEAILDGEIVAFDEAGRPSFGRLQQRMHIASDSAVRRKMKAVPAIYVVFDLLWLDGHSLMDEPWTERRAALEALALEGRSWRTPSAHIGEGSALLAASKQQGLEGVMAKRLDSVYDVGRRGGSWVKVKNVNRETLVIGGWLPGEGRRKNRIGALLVGERGGPDGAALRYAGRVGTGFTDKTLAEVRAALDPLETDENPFGARRGPRGAYYVEPVLEAEVAFTEWTGDGVLRAPSFKGLVTPDGGATASESDGDGRDASAAGRLIADARPVRGGVEVSVGGHRQKLSNLDKVLYPDGPEPFTKRDVIDYYARIAPVLLPHLRDRPLTLVRFPDGVAGKSFFQKQAPSHTPEWVRRESVSSRRAKGGRIDYVVCDDSATLVWAANLAALELHPSLSRFPEIPRPTMVVFDLDPGPKTDIVNCCELALDLRGLFEQLALASVAKTSGSKGLQVYVPLNSPEATYDQTKVFAQKVAETFEARFPKRVVSRQAKDLRAGKILIDWSQNDEHKTTVAVYSLRAKTGRPTVSTPVSWDEVERCASAGDADLLRFEARDVLARVEADGDLFGEALSAVQAVPVV
jgi:bifunctional non-homologous end joining protein LigD